MYNVGQEDLKNSIIRLQEKYSLQYHWDNLTDRTPTFQILANLISSLIDDDSSVYSTDCLKKKVLCTVIQGVDFAVCPYEGCDIKYTWNCFRHLKNHARKEHGLDVIKERKRRPLDQLKESTKRQYKYCPPRYYDDQNEQESISQDRKLCEIITLSPVSIDGQEYFTCPKDGCVVKYPVNAFRHLKKHAEMDHSLQVVKERKRRPVDQLKESTKRQYKYCPPKHYEDRVKIDEPGYFFGFLSSDKGMEYTSTKDVKITTSFLKVVNNV